MRFLLVLAYWARGQCFLFLYPACPSSSKIPIFYKALFDVHVFISIHIYSGLVWMHVYHFNPYMLEWIRIELSLILLPFTPIYVDCT
jgi:hypothetical protein